MAESAPPVPGHRRRLHLSFSLPGQQRAVNGFHYRLVVVQGVDEPVDTILIGYQSQRTAAAFAQEKVAFTKTRGPDIHPFAVSINGMADGRLITHGQFSFSLTDASSVL
ncbi:hypothetical protein GF271_17375 [Salmonella enterica subsp. enterica serovar Newport]|nr:hypothetical protein [Salmonella enterica subsp. enterica serovar Newport]